MNVDPEQLAASASEVIAQAGFLLAEHDSTEVESALVGWVGQSHAALSEAGTHWTGVARALSARMLDHGAALRTTGLSFTEMEIRHAESLLAVRPVAGPS